MQEPPTSIIHPSPTHGPRFLRAENGAPPQEPRPPKPKLKKLRLALVVLGLSVLALISTVFGMLMAVASDLPSLDSKSQFAAAENSVLYPRGLTRGLQFGIGAGVVVVNAAVYGPMIARARRRRREARVQAAAGAPR